MAVIKDQRQHDSNPVFIPDTMISPHSQVADENEKTACKVKICTVARFPIRNAHQIFTFSLKRCCTINQYSTRIYIDP